jgi:hypothetical protein
LSGSSSGGDLYESPGGHKSEAIMHCFSRSLAVILAVIAVSSFGLLSHEAAAQSTEATPSPEAPYTPTITPSDFSQVIDNPYMPFKPGTTYIYDGTKDGEKQRDDVTVTSDTKVILGVTCVVVLDQVTANGDVIEKTFDWYAQDNAGNVWYFGEDSTSYEDGKASKEGSWEAGVDGAWPGIVMPAQPKIGDIYRQEYQRGVAEDMAEIIAVTGSATVPYGAFDNILVTKEWTPLEPGIEEEMTYAPGIGNISAVSTKGENERWELVDVKVASEASPEATPGY